MTVELVHRPARITPPLVTPKPEVLAPPPATIDPRGQGLGMYSVLPVVGGLSAGVMIVFFRSNRVFLVLGAVIVVVALVGGLAMALSQRGGSTRRRRTERENYLDYLERLRARVSNQAAELRTAALLLDPAPEGLLDLVRDPGRLWERRRRDLDFLMLRVGLGDRRLFVLTVPPEQDPVQPYEPMLLGEAATTAAQAGLVQDVPVTVRLDSAGQVSIVGDRADRLALARSLLLQLATQHAPDDVAVAVAFPPEVAADWRGVDLLPHLLDRRGSWAAGSRRISPLWVSCWPRSSPRAPTACSSGGSGARTRPRRPCHGWSWWSTATSPWRRACRCRAPRWTSPGWG